VEFGRLVSDWIAGYREFVHGLVQMLQLPSLPQFAYDAFGVIGFSIGRGYWLGSRASERGLNLGIDLFVERMQRPSKAPTSPAVRVEKMRAAQRESSEEVDARYPLAAISERLLYRIQCAGDWQAEDFELRAAQVVLVVLVYGGLVAIVIAALFGI